MALALVQACGYAVPLLTVPYVARMLGVEVYGKMVFAQAMIGYLMLMVEYGFSWSTARKIAAHRHDRDFISRTFVAAFVGQWLLVAPAFLLCGAVVLCVDRLREDMWLYAAVSARNALQIKSLRVVQGRLITMTWQRQYIEQKSD